MEPLSSYAAQVIEETDVAVPATDLDVLRDTDATGGGLTLQFKSSHGSGYDMLDRRGDSFMILGVQPALNYQFQLIWKETGEVLASASFLG